MLALISQSRRSRLIPFSHFWLIGKINVLYHALADAREYRGWDFPELSHGTYDLSFSVLFCFFFLPLDRTLSLSRIEYTRSSRIHTHSYRDITRRRFRILHYELHYIFLDALAKFSLSPKSFRIKINDICINYLQFRYNFSFTKDFENVKNRYEFFISYNL